MEAQKQSTWPEVADSADPERVELSLARLAEVAPAAMERAHEDPSLRRYLVAVIAASPFLTRACLRDPLALSVLTEPKRSVGPLWPLSRWKHLEVLRIAAQDLAGELSLEEVGEALSQLATSLLQAACARSGLGGDIAVIGMGKLGGRELNYGSDIDIVLAGTGDALAFLELVRPAWRIDLDLRPEGRSGPLVRSLASYEAYWDRWAQTWEFQALIKARPLAGNAELGDQWAEAAARRVWGRALGADELRSLREMKAKSELLVGRKGLSQRELKLGWGGIRDIEFSVQLLQLVHGRQDRALRVPSTLSALGALAAGGYVASQDAQGLSAAYRFLRSVEHRLQLFQDRQVHALPESPAARAHLARVMGYRDSPSASALQRFEADLRRHRAMARAIHERLFFRPLLEAFTSRHKGMAGGPEGLTLAPEAVEQRLSAFGFTDARRTKEAVVELTQGLSRTSRLMRAMVPLLLDWLSASADPDLGLLGLRRLATGPHRRAALSALFRESAEAARQLCLLVGTSPLFVEGYEHHPDQLALLASGPPPLPSTLTLERRMREAIAWRPREQWWHALASIVRGELLRVQARDILGLAGLAETERTTTSLAEAVVSACLTALAGAGELGSCQGVALVAMGRFGGSELSYASDLDIMVVFDDAVCEPAVVEHLAEELLELVNGQTPAQRLYTLDLSLRPEGRKGPLARSLKAFESYYRRWAHAWERQALLRGRFLAGDPEVGQRFGALVKDFVWGQPLSADDVREIRALKARMERERVPAGEDPEFHLKLGPGSLSDVEWTVQLLQLQAGVQAEGTLEALSALVAAGALSSAEGEVLAEAYRFCEATRNRLFLVRGRPASSLPPPGHYLTVLARSLGMSAPGLREEYRRLTRRSRRVTEKLFYGKPGLA